MKAIHNITIDIIRKNITPTLHAMQYDALSRVVEVALLANGEAFTPPAGTSFALSYRKADGKRGFYDKLPDGTDAITLSGSTVSVTLAPQVLTCPGTVAASLVLRGEQNRLSAFPFAIRVEADPGAGTSASEDYYRAQWLPMPEKAAVGQFFRIKAVDESGKVTAVEAVDLDAQTPASYLFGGVALPPLPETDKAYAFMYESWWPSTNYTLFLAREIQYKQLASGDYDVVAVDYESYACFPEHEKPEWTQSIYGESLAVCAVQKVTWANFDVLNADGSVCLPATDPVSVFAQDESVLYTEQELTEEQKVQARANIGADAAMPLMLNLADYGIDYATPLLSGGGAAVYEDVGAFWEAVDALKPGQPLLLTSYFGSFLIVPHPATLYYDTGDGGMQVNSILSTITFYYNKKFLVATSNLHRRDDSTTVLSVAVTAMVDAPQPEEAAL